MSVPALEVRLLLDTPPPVTPDTVISQGINGIDGVVVLLIGRNVDWTSSASSATGHLFDVPDSWKMTNYSIQFGMTNSAPPLSGYAGTLTATLTTPSVEYNQVRGTTGINGLFVTVSNLFGGGFPPGEWSQGGTGTGGFSVHKFQDVVSSQVSLTTSNGCNTVVDDESGVGGADAGEMTVNLHIFAAGTYTMTFEVVTIFSVSGGGAGGSVSMSSGVNHTLNNPGTAPLTARFSDTIQRTVSIGDDGSGVAFRWTPTIGMHLATVENTTIEGHIALTSIEQQ